MEINVRPVPIPDPVTQFFWDSAKEGKLSVQGFAGHRHPATPAQPGVRILTNIVEADPAELRCGLPMEVVFEQREDFALPQFRPRRD